jgi:hypothetical protein
MSNDFALRNLFAFAIDGPLCRPKVSGEPMEFVSAEPSLVKSIKQLDFLKTWLRLHAKKKSLAPVIADFEPDRVEDEKPDLVYYRVEWSREQPRIRINSHGSRVAQAYGKVGRENQGRYLDDYLGPDVARDVLPIYNECIRRVRPVYTVSAFDDIHGRRVIYERLLLPFSDGTAVTDIVASLKTISEDGRFEITNLFRSVDQIQVHAVIDRDSNSSSPVTGFSPDDLTQ